MEEISREESVKLKGVAMCVIVLHNFVHLISGVKENEMAFDEERLKLFFFMPSPSSHQDWRPGFCLFWEPMVFKYLFC